MANMLSNRSFVFSILSMQTFTLTLSLLHFDYMELERPGSRKNDLFPFTNILKGGSCNPYSANGEPEVYRRGVTSSQGKWLNRPGSPQGA